MTVTGSGIVESREQLHALVRSLADNEEFVIPRGSLSSPDRWLTHWWRLANGPMGVLYIGTPETYAAWLRRRERR